MRKALLTIFLFACSVGLFPFRAAKPAAHSAIPPLRGDHWLNSKPLTSSDLRGKVVLVDFWDYTCVNCLRTFPYLKSWYNRYHKDGLLIIGVHTPEFKFEQKVGNVSAAARKYGLKYPILLDNEYETWKAFKNEYWPREYLFDAAGKLRHDQIGEGNYAETEAEIQKLLLALHPGLAFPKPLQGLTPYDTPGAVCRPMTPELYVGYWRGSLGNSQGYRPGKVVDYKDPGEHKDGMVYASGEWLNEEQAMRHARSGHLAGDYILIKYHANEVNAVIRPEGEKNFKVYVYQDGNPLAKPDKGSDIRYDPDGKSYLLIASPRMYQVVNNAKYGSHELRLASDSPGFALYSYTFGACSAPKSSR